MKTKKKIILTPMLVRYLVQLAFRVVIFIAVAGLYLAHKPLMEKLMTQPVWNGICAFHVLWLVFMVLMIQHIFPSEKLSMAIRKSHKEVFVPVEDYDEFELLRFVQEQNVRAWRVMLVWLVFNSIFGLLYLFGIIDNADLLMLTVFYFLSDYICILFYCPFQSIIMENRCCVNCRIYDWGHFMMFTPMLFIRNFFSWSLFFMSCVVLLHWEMLYAKHPERFWSSANKKLQCANCQDKICQVKKKLAGQQ